MTKYYASEENSATWIIDKIEYNQSDDENKASYIYMVNWLGDCEGSFSDSLTWYPWIETINEAIEAHGYTETSPNREAERETVAVTREPDWGAEYQVYADTRRAIFNNPEEY